MYSRRLVFRVVAVAAVVLAAFAYSFETEPVRGIDLDASRLIATEKLPETLEACTWDIAAPERPAVQRGQGAGEAATPAMAIRRSPRACRSGRFAIRTPGSPPS